MSTFSQMALFGLRAGSPSAPHACSFPHMGPEPQQPTPRCDLASLSLSFTFLKKCSNRHFFKSSLRITANLSTKYRDFPHPPCLHTHRASPPPTSPTGVGPWLQPMSLQRHVIITQSPVLTSGFVLGAGHPVGLGRRTVACTRHSDGMQTGPAGLQSSALCQLFPLHPWQPLIILLSP